MGREIAPMEPMEYINHPEEQIRMLRYFARPQMDPQIRLVPEYPREPSIGVVISTYGSIPYLDLNLHYLIRVNRLRVLIHDDCSPQREALLELSRRYAPHLELASTYQRMWHRKDVGAMGDTNAFLFGLNWARDNHFDLLLKLSRRLVAVSEFAPALRRLAVESDGFTFGNYCDYDDFPLRTECVAMCVRAWSHPYITNQLSSVLRYQFPVFAEYWFHDLARMLDYANSSGKYRRYVDAHRIGASHSGFVQWGDLVSTSRYNPVPGALWHSCNSLEEYVQAAGRVLGNRYTLEDFQNCEMF